MAKWRVLAWGRKMSKASSVLPCRWYMTASAALCVTVIGAPSDLASLDVRETHTPAADPTSAERSTGATSRPSNSCERIRSSWLN